MTKKIIAVFTVLVFVSSNGYCISVPFTAPPKNPYKVSANTLSALTLATTMEEATALAYELFEDLEALVPDQTCKTLIQQNQEALMTDLAQASDIQDIMCEIAFYLKIVGTVLPLGAIYYAAIGDMDVAVMLLAASLAFLLPGAYLSYTFRCNYR